MSLVANAKKRVQNPLDYDPTRTTSLRRQFISALTQRLDRISRRITQLVDRDDAFGLRPSVNYDPNQPRVPAGSPQGGEWKGKTSVQGVYQSIVQDVMDRFPKLKKLPPLQIEVHEGRSISTEGTIGGSIHPGESMYGQYVHGQGRVDIAADIPDRGPITLKGDTVGFSKEIAIRHELGHHVQDHHRDHIQPIDPVTGRRMSWQNTTRDYVGSDKPITVSEYAHRSHKELFAESFAVYTDRSYVRGSLPKPIEHYFDVTFGSPISNHDVARLMMVSNARWQFRTTPEQVAAFQEWLEEELSKELLDDNNPDGWWNEYIRRGYEQGAGRSFDDVRLRGKDKKQPFYQGSREEFLRSSFAQPVSKERVKLLAGRTLTDLKGVSQAMATQMSRELVDGLVRGESPRTVARRLTGIVGKNKSRALTIARTETIRAHAEGQLDALEMMGVTQLGVAVEWSTAKFNVCPLCQPLEGVVLSVKEARGLLPRHPNCRCAFIPANVGETDDPQKKTKSAKQAALDESVKAEIPEKSKRSLKEQKKRTSWSGADLKPEDAPKSILDD